MKMTKITAIVAAAALLVIGAAFTSMAATYDWQFENGEWVCYNKDGDQYYSEWAQSASGDWYYLGDEGVMVTNQKLESRKAGKYVYVGADGSIQKDLWVKLLVDDSGEEDVYKWFYFGSDGYMYANKKKAIGDKTYIFNSDGEMLSGWARGYKDASGSNVYTNEDIDYACGNYYCGGEDEGAVTTGWKQIDIATDDDDSAKLKWFYFDAKGVKYAKAEAKKINGKYYTFEPETGVMKSEWAYDTASKSYIASQSYYSSPEDGARVSKGWFRAFAPGATDDQKDEGENIHWYYAESQGKLATSKIKKINGKKYCFNDEGIMQSGLVWVALENATSSIVTDVQSATDKLDCDTLIDALKAGKSGYALYYFSGDELNDGSMKFGTQKVTFDDEDFTIYFSNSKGNGQAQNTQTENGIYYNGVKLTADSDLGYGIVSWDGTNYGKEVLPLSILNGKTNVSNYRVINKAGKVLKKLNTKDYDGYKVEVDDYIIKKVEYAD